MRVPSFAVSLALTALGVSLFFAAPASAAQDALAAVKPVADTPAAKVGRSATVSVEHEGADTLGAKLAFQLKDLFNASSLFTLSEQDEPKIKVLLSTAEEFPSRPGLGSVYAVVWVFSPPGNMLSFTLARDVGVCGPDDVKALPAKIAERTDGVAVRYGYLFKKD